MWNSFEWQIQEKTHVRLDKRFDKVRLRLFFFQILNFVEANWNLFPYQRVIVTLNIKLFDIQKTHIRSLKHWLQRAKTDGLFSFYQRYTDNETKFNNALLLPNYPIILIQGTSQRIKTFAAVTPKTNLSLYKIQCWNLR